MRREHAIIDKVVINHDAWGRHLRCGWDECDKQGYESYKHVQCLHDIRVPCARADKMSLPQAGRTAHLDHVFCTWRHRAYFVAAYGVNALDLIERTGRAYGNLPPGMRHRFG